MTDLQIRNLEILANFLELTQPHLNMRHFALSEHGDPTNHVHQCKTPSCMMGWAVALFQPDDVENYWDASDPLFGILPYCGNNCPFDFLFGPQWPDDPIEGAGRIRYFLKHGVPPYYEQGYRRYAHVN